MVDQSPTAYVPEVLVALNSRFLGQVCFVCGLSDRVLAAPPVHYEKPLLEG